VLRSVAMRDRPIVAFERAVFLLLSMPVACGGRIGSGPEEREASGPVGPRAPHGRAEPFEDEAGARLADANPDIFAPQYPVSAEAGSVTSIVDAAPSRVTDDGGCVWFPSTDFGDCVWVVYFNGDAVACTGLVNGMGFGATCAQLCGVDSTGKPAVIGQPAGSCNLFDPPAGSPFGAAHAVGCSLNSDACRLVAVGNGGRRPAYFAALGFGPARAGREVGTHFARAACMEAGSVEAFRRLRDELRAHRAPARLVRAASQAVRDELRHVHQTSALARRFGERPLGTPLPPDRALRGLEEVALDNAVEGCVRETYSALECMWQAERAGDPVVRSTMTRIARDEMEHLAFSWSVHAWTMRKLGRAARARVRDAQREQIQVLAGELVRDPVEPLVRTAGLPRASVSQALIATIASQLGASGSRKSDRRGKRGPRVS
jgi:hypothetical protein